MSTDELQIAERARRHNEEALHSLNRFIDEALLGRCYKHLNKNSSSGVDGENWYEFGIEAQVHIPELLRQFKTGEYKAPNIRRAYIPKGDGSRRPLGIPTIADKVLQAGVRSVLEPIYEKEFKNFSYAFRPNRSTHQAIDYMTRKITFDNDSGNTN
jgi:RNA-directed DNA polymerase